MLLASMMVVGAASPALAHDPIFVADDQTTPDNGPFMPDGSISWALYGQVLSDGDTRGFEFDLRDGDEVFVSLLIPNLSPEVDLADEELPIIELEAPDGSTVTIGPEVREVFDEPFSKTSYVTLAEYRQPAQPGRYRGVVIGAAPSRFSVAIGETEIFFTETERSGDRPTNFAEITEPLTAWYTTPPGGEQDLTALAEGEAEIDLEMIEEAMESGGAQAPEGSADAVESAVDAASAAAAEASAAVAEAEAEAEEALAEAQAAVEAAEQAAEEALADEEDALDAAEEAMADEEDALDAAQETLEAASETASAASAGAEDAGSGSTWVAPAVIGAIAVLGGAAFVLRRGKGDEIES